MVNPNILSQRYTTKKINEIFSEEGRILAERELWIAVMKAQQELGLDIPSEEIIRYEQAKTDMNLNRINEIEKITRHDVKAKIEAFVEAAGAQEHIHKGMTSRDLTDNVEQMQFKKASQIIFGKYISILRHFLDKAKEYPQTITSRTHHQPAQPTILGRRFSMWAEELYFNLEIFEDFLKNYPLRGIKGPVGTQADLLALLGDERKVEILEEKVANLLGFQKTLSSPGQVYARSLDYQLVSQLSFLSSSCENFALTMRLMAGSELVTEGFKEGQTGSSAMPHKMNTRSSERICGLGKIIKGYQDMVSRLSGDQWEEGDVSCSVIRRVALPDSFYAADGLCETTLTILNEMGIYPKLIEAELNKYLPFLATTKILMAAVKSGYGREQAHEIIKRHAVQEALKMREGEQENLINLLSEEFKGIDICAAVRDTGSLLGNAYRQIEKIVEKTGPLLRRYSQEAAYEPEEII
ncbi:MAG: adenylosuccinate lyase [Candidatus Woesearchaeota archaeon]